MGDAFGTHGAARFDALAWAPSPSGQPLLPGALAWLDCAIVRVMAVGDHDLVIGEVGTAEVDRPAPSQQQSVTTAVQQCPSGAIRLE